MSSRRAMIIAVSWLGIGGLLLGCEDDGGAPDTGFLSVSVLDQGVGPVSGQAISISPAGMDGETNAEGIATFELAAGEYVVDADVCCVGPGFIQYHVPVTVVAGDTSKVTLDACLSCE